jgi:hypothetical protein
MRTGSIKDGRRDNGSRGAVVQPLPDGAYLARQYPQDTVNEAVTHISCIAGKQGLAGSGKRACLIQADDGNGCLFNRSARVCLRCRQGLYGWLPFTVS